MKGKIYTQEICDDCLQYLVNGSIHESSEEKERCDKTLDEWSKTNYIPLGSANDNEGYFSHHSCDLCNCLPGNRFEYSFLKYKTIDMIITNVNSSYGAPMGRQNIGEKHTDKRIFDRAVPMSSDGAYDRGGVYWGIGPQLRVSYTKDLSYIHFYRTL
jgi:hypothetical protein